MTSGPIEESDLRLPEISRRSPLAPWKALVNAIVSFYGRGDSVPSRLVPASDSMLGSAPCASGNFSAQKLIAASAPGRATLESALVSLESAFAARKRQQISKTAVAAVSACRQFRPDCCDKLCELIVARVIVLHLPFHELRESIVGPPRGSARWYRLLARALEQTGICGHMADALIAWHEFRESALRENWFRSGTAEDGGLWLHMAELAASIPAQAFKDLMWPASRQVGTSKATAMPQLFSPQWLYEKACAADPDPEVFRSWLRWAHRQPDKKAAERAAEAWHEARPQDVDALLCLIQTSERRCAYQKSLDYLEKAQRLDPLSPAVRRAKLRLMVATSLRHLRQRKLDLALAEIERIEQLPALECNLALLTSALRMVLSSLRAGSDQSENSTEAEACRADPVAAYALKRAIAAEVLLEDGKAVSFPPDVNSHSTAALLKALAKACALGEWAGIPASIPDVWQDRLLATVMSEGFTHDTLEMLLIGEAAIRSQDFELAFAVSAAGM
ncbi:MAG: hypothetical protein JO159_02135, partial [Acidobacteria bacterium]|nr:hypothetical protein [Acidobacteriota bacterium]